MTHRFLWIALALCALLELGAHARFRSTVPTPADYQEAGKRVRADFRPGDAITAAPAYIDPLLRHELGDLVPLAMAGRPDLSAYGRLWVLAANGARSSEVPPPTRPEFSQDYGSLTLSRYVLPKPTELQNLVQLLPSAEVEVVRPGGQRPCPLFQGLPEAGGALGKGTVPPAERFRCGPGRDRMVAAVVIEDLALRPRYCVWHPTLAGQVLRVRFPHLPLGDELVIDAGLYYEHERNEDQPDVTLDASIDGKTAGKLVHQDGQGFVRLTIPTPRDTHADVAFEAHSTRRKHPGFCWSASTRKAAP